MTAVQRATSRFDAGSLVRARGREWVVLPESNDSVLVVRPLGGADDEVTGIDLAFEGADISAAHFALPTAADLGDHRTARLLHQAVRLSIRDGAGPFRSFGRIAVEPRPYQLVPLLMALRLDPVRLLIADDVGIGKTVEALLIARELLDRGEIDRIAVLAPPHLADQWQTEMRSKFHLDAELVLPSTAARLERGLRLGESLFERHQHVVVSLDFIKSDRHRAEFLRTAPRFVIVDEAHGSADPGARRGGRHQRAELVRRLAEDPRRHLVLVTATPHSGNEAAFRELLGYLDRSFLELPDDLSGATNESARRRLARHLVQRRRVDIRVFLDAETPFPERLVRDETYALTKPYDAFVERVIKYARETARDHSGGARRQRVRWWSALALLRAIGSSPAAAAATLRERSRSADAGDAAEVDEIGRRSVLDLEDESSEGSDVIAGADPADPEEGASGSTRRRLLDLARAADGLAGKEDAKVAKGVAVVRGLLADGHAPIVFCRFIATAEYVKDALRGALPNDVVVEAVTGLLPAAERRARVEALGEESKRVLVATDCLSEGINLQDHFDAVVHYDLSWNPTRHEQREGRVDRYGQNRPEVKIVTLYGSDNPIDGIVLSVLLRKHKTIRDRLGISVPVPVDSNTVLEAILEGILLRGRDDQRNVDQLSFWEREIIDPQRKALFEEWDRVADRETRSRSLFAHHAFPLEDVIRARDAARAAVGTGVEVRRFVIDALRAHGAGVLERPTGAVDVDVREVSRSVRDVAGLGGHDLHRLRFEPPFGDAETIVGRTHPIVDGLSGHLMDTALDPLTPSVARRAGVIRSSGVTGRTTVLLLRMRFDLRTRTRAVERSALAEEVRLVAFSGQPDTPVWLDEAAADALLDLPTSGNVLPEQAADALARVTGGMEVLQPALDRLAAARAADLLAEHDRVRSVAELRGRTVVRPQLPADILGIYVVLPAPVA